MYKCLNLENNRDINILERIWSSSLAGLRELDHNNSLACPGCLQPVRVRAGSQKRWHFAHKHLANCPFLRESPELLNARAILYRRMVELFGEDQVTIEKNDQQFDIPRPLDVWVVGKFGPFAYWIIDTRIPPDERERLQKALTIIQAPVNVIFLSDILRLDEEDSSTIYLSTTERDFLIESPYDRAWKELSFFSGKTIHYLDAEGSRVITFRNIQLVHLPQQHTGTCLETPLSNMVVDELSGEFTHPGEKERLKRRPIEQPRSDSKSQKEKNTKRRLHSPLSPARLTIPGLEDNGEPDILRVPLRLVQREGICRICGNKSFDWVQFFGDSGECICRECHNQKNSKQNQ